MRPILRKIDPSMNASFSIREDIYPHLFKHWHYHPETELTYVRKGTGMRLVGDNVEQFEDGDLILLGGGLPHLWRSDDAYFDPDSDLHIEAITIHFMENFWGDTFLQLPEMTEISELFTSAKRGIKILGKTKQLIIEKMEAMLHAKHIQRIEYLLHLLNLITTTEEYCLLSSAGYTTCCQGDNSEKINSIYQYTFENFRKQISINDIARAAHLSPNSFCRYFKSRTMKTYWDFLVEVRIGYACKLLIENKMTIAQICYASGFNNLSNFNRHFRERLNKTPLQFVKEYN